MIENNSDIANKLEELHPTIATPSIEMLQARIAELDNQLAEMTTSKESWYQSWSELRASIHKAEQAFRDILAGDMDASDIVETYGEAFTEHLGWQFAREVEIEISVTWRGTIELPHGVDVDDLDVDDFGIEINGHHEYESEIRSHFESYSIDER
jgi:hypothetical protein